MLFMDVAVVYRSVPDYRQPTKRIVWPEPKSEICFYFYLVCRVAHFRKMKCFLITSGNLKSTVVSMFRFLSLMTLDQVCVHQYHIQINS
jgi:hypothetical protein